MALLKWKLAKLFFKKRFKSELLGIGPYNTSYLLLKGNVKILG